MIIIVCFIEYDVNIWLDLYWIFKFVIEKYLLLKFYVKMEY